MFILDEYHKYNSSNAYATEVVQNTNGAFVELFLDQSMDVNIPFVVGVGHWKVSA